MGQGETSTVAGTFSRPSTVLQTYTVPLQQVRRELEKWKEPLTDEYMSLTSNTRALRPTTVEALKSLGLAWSSAGIEWNWLILTRLRRRLNKITKKMDVKFCLGTMQVGRTQLC